jgi:hypothetical protein
VKRAKEALQVLEMNLSVEVGSAADVVWKIVGNFNGMPAWHPLVRASVLEPAEGGVGRRVTIGGDRAGHRELTERLVSFNSSARAYTYTIIAGPVPFTDYVGRFHVVPAGTGRCTVEYRGRYRPEAGRSESEASERIRTFYEAAFDNLPVLFGA